MTINTRFDVRAALTPNAQNGILHKIKPHDKKTHALACTHFALQKDQPVLSLHGKRQKKKVKVKKGHHKHTKKTEQHHSKKAPQKPSVKAHSKKTSKHSHKKIKSKHQSKHHKKSKTPSKQHHTTPPAPIDIFAIEAQKALPQALLRMKANKQIIQELFTKEIKKISALFNQKEETTGYVPIDAARKIYAIRDKNDLYISLPEQIGNGAYKVINTALKVLFQNKNKVFFEEIASLRPTNTATDVTNSMQHEIEIIRKLGFKVPGIMETHLLHPSSDPSQVGIMAERCDNDFNVLVHTNKTLLAQPLSPKDRLTIYINQLSVLLEAAQGLEHMHARNIFHGDIKPANILTSNNYRGKLSDFGFATEQFPNTPLANTNLLLHIRGYGTNAFSAPEFVRNHPVANYFAADIWAFGLSTAYAQGAWNFDTQDTWFHDTFQHPSREKECYETLYTRLIGPFKNLYFKKATGPLSVEEEISYEQLALVMDICTPGLRRDVSLLTAIQKETTYDLLTILNILAPEKRPKAQQVVNAIAASKARLEQLKTLA